MYICWPSVSIFIKQCLCLRTLIKLFLLILYYTKEIFHFYCYCFQFSWETLLSLLLVLFTHPQFQMDLDLIPKTFTYSLFTVFIIYTHDNSNSATIIFCFLHIFICRQSPQTKKTISDIHAFFISNIFISNARLKSAKNQANAKQHSEAELLLFENYSHSSPTLSSKNNRTYSTYSEK